MVCKVTQFVLLILVLQTSNVMAQYGGYIFSNFTDKNGLPHSTVRTAIEDRDGFIWINTWDGICFFDGQKFHQVELTNEDGASKVNQDFYELADGRIWISNTKKTIWQFDKFQNEYPGDSIKDFTKSRPIGYYENKTIFHIIDDDTYFHIDSLNRKLPVHFEIQAEGEIKKDLVIFQINDTFAWCHSGTHFYLASIKELTHNSFKLIILNEEEYNIQPYNINKNTFYENNNIVEVNDLEFDTLMRFDQHTELKNLIPLRIIKNKSDIWIYMKSSRLFIYNLVSESLIEIHSSAWNHEITSLSTDRSGNVWLGTANGLIRAEKSNKWNMYQSSIDTVIDERICMLVKDRNGRVWAGGTEGNIFSYNQDKTLDKIIELPYSNNASTIRYSGRVFGMSLDQDDDLWVSIKDDYSLFKINTINSQIEKQNIKSDVHVNPQKRILRTIFLKDENEMWTGGYNTLHSYDLKSEILSTYSQVEDGDDYIGTIWKIVGDRSDNLWLGTRSLKFFDSKEKSFTSYFLNSESPSNQINYVFALYLEPTEKYLWVGSFGDGLHRFDIEKREFDYSLTEKDGLANNIVYAIYPDDYQRLWLATMDGISCFDKISKTCVNFDLPMNFEINEINSEAHFQDQETGEILLGGMKGALGFYPDTLFSIAKNEKLNPIFIQNIRSDGKVLSKNQSFNRDDSILLPKGENQIEFDFVSPNSNQVKIQYRYRLDGVDTKWVYPAKDRRYVSYNNLDEGSYMFHVQAKLIEQHWGENRKDIEITIEKLFWQTSRFRFILGIIILCIASYILFLKFKNLLLKKDAQEKEIEKQTAILQSLSTQMNPHFLYNSLNSINNFIVNSEERKANEYLGDFASLMRKILNNSKFEKITLANELECIDLYVKLEQLRLSNGFVFKKKIDPSLNMNNIYIPSMLIQPFIENAIWHGLRHINEKGLLELSILKEAQNVICRINDNGVGLTRSKQINGSKEGRKSTGIDNVKKRLDILNKINNENLNLKVHEIISEGVIRGTQVTILISKFA